MEPEELRMPAVAVWQASSRRVQCLSRFGLDFPVREMDRWVQVMRLMTEVSARWQGAAS
jgi:hypothetical protein